MRKFYAVLAAAALLVAGSAFGITTAGAKSSAKSAVKAHAAAGKRGPRGFKGPRGPRGFTGPQGPRGFTGATGATGPQGPAGTSGSGGSLSNFSRLVPFNGTLSVTIGSFTVEEVAGNNFCNDILVIDNSPFNAEVSVIGGGAQTSGPGDFVPLASAGQADVSLGGFGAGDLDTFSAVTVNGGSNVTGTVGAITLGNGCLTTGSVSGS